MNSPCTLLQNIAKIHTTKLGADRIQKNLSLPTTDIVAWCREKIQDPSALICRKGKNWYISIDDCILTVNAYSYTIITAHPMQKAR